MKGSTVEREEYVSRVLKLYLGLAETPARSSRLDRRLAEELYEKQIEIEEVEAAMILAGFGVCCEAPMLPNWAQSDLCITFSQ